MGIRANLLKRPLVFLVLDVKVKSQTVRFNLSYKFAGVIKLRKNLPKISPGEFWSVNL